MLYQKKISDPILIQSIILHTLNKCDSPVAYNDLLNLVLENCNIIYNDFQLALDNLVQTEHLQTFLEGKHNQKYAITEKGATVSEFFRSRIPVYIREPIEESIKQLFRDQRLRNAVRGDITPIAQGDYSADCALYDDDNTCLMKISLYAGPREDAEKTVRYFKANSDKVYLKILEAFSPDFEKRKAQTNNDNSEDEA